MTNTPSDLHNFFSPLTYGPSIFQTSPIDDDLRLRPNPPIPWFEFTLPDFPHEKILNEVSALREIFVEHRPGEKHLGWKALCLHGIDAHKTNCYFDYGYENEDDVDYRWTEISDKCPVTTKYFQDNFPADSFRRIRFMLVEPNGYIFPHKDRDENYLGPLSICLNAPEDCLFGLENHGLIPLKPGKAYLIDIANKHSVWNRSEKPRFHIAVETNPGSRYKEYIDIIKKEYRSNLENA